MAEADEEPDNSRSIVTSSFLLARGEDPLVRALGVIGRVGFDTSFFGGNGLPPTGSTDATVGDGFGTSLIDVFKFESLGLGCFVVVASLLFCNS